jgi:conjugal transfer/entry exclusion protein
MTQTIQPLSHACLNKTEKNLNTDKPEAAETMQQLLSVCDSLNTLCEKLSKLDYILKRKYMELTISNQNKEEVLSALRSRLNNIAAHAAKKEGKNED